MAVHQLLRQKELEVELSHAMVDKDKCAICLTCIRSCPYKAMVIDREEGVAACLPEVCQRCGICAGECPAKAITLPAYSDEIVMNYLD
jgi:heterodisulfide reductase subunit A-like polyferredoxin